mmetsp:Transcript_13385/g.24954  ORF Transcript_13385/g.24954 Transcript_13385/m.24954 type:complete len:546 (+) Transcript_13385:86-1723(+)
MPRHVVYACIASTAFLPIAAQSESWHVIAMEGAQHENHFKQLFAEDWTSTLFDEFLANSMSEYVLVEFYAPWCGHCQAFAPEFQRLSHAIRRGNGELVGQFGGAQHASTRQTILPAALDCVRYAQMCDFFGVDSYPMLLWGRRLDWMETICFNEPAKRRNFACANSVTKLDPISARTVGDALTADNVANWINNRTSARLTPMSKEYMDQVMYQQQPQSRTPIRFQDDSIRTSTELWDAQLAVALWLRHIFDKQIFSRQSPASAQHALENHTGTFKSIMDFIDVLALRFPDTKKDAPCRKSLVDLQDLLRNDLLLAHDLTSFIQTEKPNLADSSERFRINADKLEEKWNLCGVDWSAYAAGWHSCRGTGAGKRGFTCGLWNLFHMLAAQSSNEAAASDLQGVRQAILDFFDCQECRDHFAQIPEPVGGRLSRQEAQLWWWRAHNTVNRRVRQSEEKSQDGDAGFPKIQWPSKAQCPACHVKDEPAALSMLHISRRAPRLRGLSDAASETDGNWNLAEVSKFLGTFYRSLDDSNHEDEDEDNDHDEG